MSVNFRNGFYAGFLVAAIAGIWLATLWQPERQIRLHTAHLFSRSRRRIGGPSATFLVMIIKINGETIAVELSSGSAQFFEPFPMRGLKQAVRKSALRTVGASGRRK
jgi:hypothetical protein